MFVIYDPHGKRKLHTSQIYEDLGKNGSPLLIDLPTESLPCPLQGDVLIEFFNKGRVVGMVKYYYYYVTVHVKQSLK